MSLFLALKYLVPDLTIEQALVVADGTQPNNAPYLAQWLSPHPRPSDSAIAAALVTVTNQAATKATQAEATRNTVVSSLTAFTGQNIANLSNTQLAPFLRAILLKLGVLDQQGIIRNPDTWLT